jgi:hypothetical protein
MKISTRVSRLTTVRHPRRRSFRAPERAISSARACTRLMRAMPPMLIGYAQYASPLGKDRGKITQLNKPEAYKLNLWRQF